MTNSSNLSNFQAALLISISACGTLLAAILLLWTQYIQYTRRKKAYRRDKEAAINLILPCYGPMYYGITICFGILSIGELATLSSDVLSNITIYFILQFHSLCILSAVLICPVLFMFHSVSTKTFKFTTAIICTWYIISLSCLAMAYFQPSWYLVPYIGFLFFTFITSFYTAVGIMTRFIVTRIRLASTSARNFIEHLVMFSVIFAALNTFAVLNPSNSSTVFIFLLLYVSVVFVLNNLFILVLHRALLADTKFWRGLGTYNSGGIIKTDEVQNLAHPSMDFVVASDYLQDMLSRVGHLVLDFALLEVISRIGEGTTSAVYSGHYAERPVAIKLYTPSDITEDVLDEFIKEGKLLASFDHPNIIKFVGLCIRPPQIAFVTELCDQGNLKVCLMKNAAKWDMVKRIQACHDMCSAVQYIHRKRCIHRDIKTDNFFVTRDFRVKLGDFGTTMNFGTLESILVEKGRMPIDGTAEYQAPELISSRPAYSYSIDIYALGISFWEVWTGQSCYKNMTKFEIYQSVEEGYRPPMGACRGAPEEFINAMERAWHQLPTERPNAHELEYMCELSVSGGRYAGASQAIAV